MPRVKIKIPKKLQRVEIIRSEDLTVDEVESFIPEEEKNIDSSKPSSQEDVLREELEDILEDNELFEEEFIEQVLENTPEAEAEEESIPITTFYDKYSVCIPDGPVDISLENIPKEETLPLSEVRDEVQHAYDRGFDDAQQLTTNTFETQILKLQERVKQFDLVVQDFKDQFAAELDNMAKSIADVSVMVAEHILGRELLSDPDIVITQVKKAIQSIERDKIFKIHVHPDNVKILEEVRLTLDYDRSRMENVQIIPDQSVGQGGCILYTSAGIIDARIKTQLAQINNQLSQVTINIEDKEKSIMDEKGKQHEETVDNDSEYEISDEDLDLIDDFEDTEEDIS